MPSPFHYSFFVTDLASTRRFYGEILGCREGRSTETWVDFDFFGNQISAHTTGAPAPTDDTGSSTASPSRCRTSARSCAGTSSTRWPRAFAAADMPIRRRAAPPVRRASPASRPRCSSSTRAATRSNSRRSATRSTCSPREARLDRRRRRRRDRRLASPGTWPRAARATCWSLERAAGPGSGSTAAATGGFRAQFATAINVRLSLLSRAKLLRFRDEIGADPGYVPAGYLWIAEDEAALAALRDARRGAARGRTARGGRGRAGRRRAPPAGDRARRDPRRRVLARPTASSGRGRSRTGTRPPPRLGARFSGDETVIGFERGAAGRIAAVRTTRETIALRCAWSTPRGPGPRRVARTRGRRSSGDAAASARWRRPSRREPSRATRR